ncbi:hypothetical protein [Haloferula sp. BvORR071]|uniref:hypothetical protein n=1 Tax=Haloferula sp. BvORR071 TaxID=1396141 RepID=UPI000558E262|nr:hypothetical protein [Haloferula sp. BvORR071]
MPFTPKKPRVSRAIAAARRHFFAQGWSYRSAAPLLGVGYQHVSEVLNGRRESKRLLAAILALPAREKGETVETPAAKKP